MAGITMDRWGQMFFRGIIISAAVICLVGAPPVYADDFADALAATYQSNPQIKAARERVKTSDESVNQAFSGFRPSIESNYDRGRARSSFGTADWNYADTTNKQLTITQPIFEGGRTLAGFKAAKERVKAAQADLHATTQQVLFNAVTAYAEIVEKQSVLELSRKNVDVLAKQLDATQLRFKVGELTRTDVAQAESRMARAEADKHQAEGDLKSARATFERVVGYPAGKILDVPLTPPGLPTGLEEARTLAEHMSPVLLGAMFREKAADADIRTQEGRLLPSVTLQGGMSRRDGSATLNGTTSSDNDSLTMNVSIPLYQSGAEYSRVRAAKSQLQEAKFNALDARNNSIENVTRSWEDYRAAIAVIEASKQAIKASETALQGVRQENEFGVRTVLDVLDAEQEVFSNRVALVRAQKNLTVQSYRLLASVGRLIPQTLNLNVEVYDPKDHYDDVKYKTIGF